MPTTLNIDDDVLLAARQLAESTGQSLGQALSSLARASLTRTSAGAYQNGIKLLPVAPNARAATLDDENAIHDEVA
jgi:hypothetical protein